MALAEVEWMQAVNFPGGRREISDVNKIADEQDISGETFWVVCVRTNRATSITLHSTETAATLETRGFPDAKVEIFKVDDPASAAILQ